MTSVETDADGDWVWVWDRAWRLLPPEPVKRCRWGAGFRHKACGAAAVAELARTRYSSRSVTIKRAVWWAYCGEHLYGRKIVDGRILIRVRDGSPAADRGFF